jgi:TPP-dependent pyruvate/acetoin dehydrogenase alpha subunit
MAVKKKSDSAAKSDSTLNMELLRSMLLQRRFEERCA